MKGSDRKCHEYFKKWPNAFFKSMRMKHEAIIKTNDERTIN